MRHGVKGRALGRNRGHRRGLFSSMATSLLTHEQIKTTLPKAKELRPLVERLISWGKKGTLAHRRQIVALLQGAGPELQKKLVGPLAERYANRQGGYIRIVRAGFRYGDNAPMAIIELVDRDGITALPPALVSQPALAPSASPKGEATN